jgi:hypothetical protein
LKTWAWLCVAVCLTIAATICEIQALAAGITVGDMVGSPPSYTDTGRRLIRQMEVKGMQLWVAVPSLSYALRHV